MSEEAGEFTEIPKSEVYSTFEEYCETIDEMMLMKELPLQSYQTLCLEIKNNRKKFPDPNYIYNLLIKDFEHRAKFRKNIIMSIEGDQGEGKSLFGLFWAYKLGEIFGQPFNIKKNLYAIPEDFNIKIRDAKFRSTHFLDEQRKANIGVGSKATELKLMDFEEQMRWTQKNIIYASPSIKDHSHYFIFKAKKIDRVENKEYCAVCPKKYQDKCYTKQFETNCPPNFIKRNNGKKVTFWERSGYPTALTFMLKTKRKDDGYLVPRGFVTVPIVTPKTAVLYDKIKGKNIRKLTRFEDDSHKEKLDIVENFIKAFKDKCVRRKGSSKKFTVVNIYIIQLKLAEFLRGQRQMVTADVKMVVAEAKERFEEIAFKKNETLLYN